MSNDHGWTASLQQGTAAARVGLQSTIAAAIVLSSNLLITQSAPSHSTARPLSAAKAMTRHSAKTSPPRPATLEVQPTPAEPERPRWPVNDTPTKPSVIWERQALKIDATNSSLRQILDEVSIATGAKVEGLGKDERVFGEYGPGQALDVIWQLLHGSGYNVLMIGDKGEGTPREIILSAQKAAASQDQPNLNHPSLEAPDEDVPDQPEVEEQPQQPITAVRL